MEKIYRKNALAVLFNAQGKVFMGARKDREDLEWQFPQGGIEPDESPQQAAQRELQEETGIKNAVLVSYIDTPFFYDFPPEVLERFRKIGRTNVGQEQYWSLFFFTGTEDEIDFNTYPEEIEFKAFQWVDIKEAPQLVVNFKKQVYEQGCQIFEPQIAAYVKALDK